MSHEDKSALAIAKEITVAILTNANITPNEESGENVVAFFKAVYEGVSGIANNAALQQ